MKHHQDRRGPSLDLGTCTQGIDGVITGVLGTHAPTVRRLAELGIRPGATITAGQRTPGGGRVVEVAGARLALDAATLRWLQLEQAS